MKAISLWQPWASLIALGIKRIETRGWPTAYRGPLLIHAAKRCDIDRYHALVERFPEIREGIYDRFPGAAEALPLGALVAVTTVVDCRAERELERVAGRVA